MMGPALMVQGRQKPRVLKAESLMMLVDDHRGNCIGAFDVARMEGIGGRLPHKDMRMGISSFQWIKALNVSMSMLMISK